MSLFANVSQRTNSSQKDAALKPITLRMGFESSFRLVNEAIGGYPFETVAKREDFHEIYAVLGTSEFTITFIEDLGKTHLSILIYDEYHPLRNKKNLKRLMLFLRERLADHME